MSKKSNKTTKSKKKAKTKVNKDQDIYVGFEPMGVMETIPKKSAKLDFPVRSRVDKADFTLSDR